MAGRGFKIATKLRWTNITKGSSVRNIKVNKSVRSFGRALKKSGYKKSVQYSSKGKRIVNYSKGSKKYTYRGKAKSGYHTYDFYNGNLNYKGRPKVNTKIRVRRW